MNLFLTYEQKEMLLLGMNAFYNGLKISHTNYSIVIGIHPLKLQFKIQNSSVARKREIPFLPLRLPLRHMA